MDLSKVYDCISQNLLIAKLECHGIDKIGLSLILDYLSCRAQRTKISSSYSYWYDMIRGVSLYNTNKELELYSSNKELELGSTLNH